MLHAIATKLSKAEERTAAAARLAENPRLKEWLAGRPVDEAVAEFYKTFREFTRALRL